MTGEFFADGFLGSSHRSFSVCRSGNKETSSTTNVAPDMPTYQSPNDEAQYIVDHALRDALARHKHRNSGEIASRHNFTIFFSIAF